MMVWLVWFDYDVVDVVLLLGVWMFFRFAVDIFR